MGTETENNVEKIISIWNSPSSKREITDICQSRNKNEMKEIYYMIKNDYKDVVLSEKWKELCAYTTYQKYFEELLKVL